MKAVLISIQPQWCEKIAANWKNIELRKSKPSIQAPFKCYIYQTKLKWVFRLLQRLGMERVSETLSNGFGKVIGEFVCDSILGHCEMANADLAERGSFVRREDIMKYSGGKEVFGWHISDLKIYEKPLDISSFFRACDKHSEQNCSVCEESGKARCKQLRRAPQSWCYIMEV